MQTNLLLAPPRRESSRIFRILVIISAGVCLALLGFHAIRSSSYTLTLSPSSKSKRSVTDDMTSDMGFRVDHMPPSMSQAVVSVTPRRPSFRLESLALSGGGPSGMAAMGGGMPGGMPGMGGPPPPPMSTQLATLHPLALSFITTMGWNMLGFITTVTTRTHSITDLVGTSAFLLSAVTTLHSALSTQWGMVKRHWDKPARPALLALAVSLWATRLGSYLTLRMSSVKTDKRISKHFRKPGEVCLCGDSCYPINLLGYWIRQALWSWVTLLPVTMAGDLSQYKKLTTDPLAKAVAPLTLIAGGVGFIAGMALESLADYQKYKFKTDKTNPKKWRWCDTGLWSLARHPNYLGEMIIWASLFVMASPIAPTWTVVSPVFVWYLLLHRTGVPLLENDMKRKYWSLPDFDNYMRKTRLLVPLPGKKLSPPGNYEDYENNGAENV